MPQPLATRRATHAGAPGYATGSIATTASDKLREAADNHSMEIREGGPQDVDACVRVLAELPDYFIPDTHETLAAQMRTGHTWVAESDGDGLCGFVHATRRYPESAEITFAAVLPTSHGRGVGRALVSQALSDLRRDGVLVVEAKTLDASAGYEPYVATRAFWESQGFVQIDMIDPLPGWQPGNPSAIYVAALGTSR